MKFILKYTQNWLQELTESTIFYLNKIAKRIMLLGFVSRIRD